MSNMSMEIMATAEAADRLGVTPRHVARLVAIGKLKPAFKAPGIRGAYVFDVEEIERVAKGDAK